MPARSCCVIAVTKQDLRPKLVLQIDLHHCEALIDGPASASSSEKGRTGGWWTEVDLWVDYWAVMALRQS